jgi:hypothetical protein
MYDVLYAAFWLRGLDFFDRACLLSQMSRNPVGIGREVNKAEAALISSRNVLEFSVVMQAKKRRGTSRRGNTLKAA